jgi:uncharacterized protein YecE (DUF72 family)
MGQILVGTASWTDKSLLTSGWYPSGVNSAAERLAYYADHFPLVEVDSTYYFPPSEENSVRWVERTPEHFTFNVKAFSILTGHPTKADALYKDLPRPQNKKNLYPKDLEPDVVDEVWERFISALGPLVDAGKLGALLFQFPPWFVISRKNKDFILDCAHRADPLRICVEFRNNTWMTEDNQGETLDFLEGNGIPYVCVDMPQGFRSSLPPVVAATSDLALIRFHGHNAEEWESGSVQRRFKYLYSDKELEDWAPRVRRLSEEAETTHVLMNNCYRDYAQRNASELAELLKAEGAGVVNPSER